MLKLSPQPFYTPALPCAPAHTPRPAPPSPACLTLQLVCVCLYALAHLVLLRRAFVDHAGLPYSHYRLTNMYLRINVSAAMQSSNEVKK